MKLMLLAILLGAITAPGAQASVSHFDDLILPQNGYWAGTVDPAVPLWGCKPEPQKILSP